MFVGNFGLSLVVLCNVLFFFGLNEFELEKLLWVFVCKCVEWGVFVVWVVESIDLLYVFLIGCVKVMNIDEEGCEIILIWFGLSEFFGEMGLIDGSLCLVNVVVSEVCELLVLSKDDF